MPNLVTPPGSLGWLTKPPSAARTCSMQVVKLLILPMGGSVGMGAIFHEIGGAVWRVRDGLEVRGKIWRGGRWRRGRFVARHYRHRGG